MGPQNFRRACLLLINELSLLGQAARHGVRENDKIVTINGKTPRNVDDAVGVIKQAGNQIKLVVLREENVPDNYDSDFEKSGEFVNDTIDIVSIEVFPLQSIQKSLALDFR